MPDRNKVKFGISNFTWWKVTETVDSETGAISTSYSSAYKEPGLVSIGLDPQGDRTVFRADNSDYYVAAANGGYSGSLVLSDLSDDLRQFAFDEKRDDNGVVVEDDKSGVTTNYIACAFEFVGDKKNIRHLLPKCSLTKPSITSETTPEGNTPNVQTDSVTLTAVARPDDGAVHMKADPTTNTTAYDSWYTTPYIPTITPLGNMTVAPEQQSATIYEVPVSDIQSSNVAVTGNKITGTLKYLDGSDPISGYWGAGNFLALKFSNVNPRATSVKVGLDPSEGSGLVELLGDPNMNGVFKITDKDTQKFVVIQSTGNETKRQEFSLAELVLES